MIKNKAYIFSALIILVSFLIHKGCRETPPSITPTLKEGEAAKIIFNKDTVTVVKKDGNVKTSYVPTHSVVTVNDDGEVFVKTKLKGFTLEPGIGAGIGSDDFRSVFDVKFAYWNRLGLYTGVDFKLRRNLKDIDPRFHLGVGFIFPYTKNTSFVLAVDHKKDVIGYVRLRF